MSRTQVLLFLIPAAYVMGSIPFGLIVGKLNGIDPRTAGSGNIGASNVGRLLGKKCFALVFLLDLLKGAAPTFSAAAVLGFHADSQLDSLLWVLVGFAAFIGHMFSLFLAFKGGKGVATSAGVVLGVFPYCTLPGLAAMAVWAITLRITRYISVASMLAAALFPLFYILLGTYRHWPMTGAQLPLLIFAVLIPLMIIVKHRANITRLRSGTENRVPAKSL
jgi:acyl phosphate:glycerol-3-phosphate acyltransferase